MPEYYTFIKEEDASGISYDFATSTHLYSVVLSPEMYESYLDDFPTLLTQGFEFSFFRRQHKTGIKESSVLVRNTIFKIIELHFNEHGTKTVLLYQCDTLGDLEKARSTAFDNWATAEDCYLKDFLIKESLEVVIPKQDGSNRTYYIGYIAHIANPDIEELKKEFSMFGYQLPLLQKTDSN